jgi:MtN3 and saliva related transmembrane protein
VLNRAALYRNRRHDRRREAHKVMRDRDTRALSLPATLAFTAGVTLWLVYGLTIGDWTLIGSNAVTLALMLPIVAMKLRYG